MLIKIADRRRAARHRAVAAPPPLPRPLVAVARPSLASRRLLLVSGDGGDSSKGCARPLHLEPLHHNFSSCTLAAAAAAAATTSSFTSSFNGSGRALKSRSTRAAFATADIRRALARSARQQQQQQQRRPAMRHFELDWDARGERAEKAFRSLPAAAAPRQSFLSRTDNHDDEQQPHQPDVDHAAQVVVAQWPVESHRTSSSSSSGGPREISSGATVISDILRERRHSNPTPRRSGDLEPPTGGAEHEARTKSIQIESYARPSGTRSQIAQEPRGSAYANTQLERNLKFGSKLETRLLDSASELHRTSESQKDREEQQRATKQAPTKPKLQHQQQEVMSTQSFVPGGDQLVHQQQQQQEFSHHLGRQHQQEPPLISAHPIGLGCFGGATSTGGGGGQTMDPVAGASDGSVVMTSSGALSPDDEHERFAPRAIEPRAHQLRHSIVGLAAAAAAVAGDSSQLSLNNSGDKGPSKSFLGKLVGKKASRLRELVLQNLGKADRTQDELFDLYEINFYKQQHQVARLTKEFKLYSSALRAYHEASRSLNKCIQQATTDYQSARHDLVCENLTHLEQLNEDLMDKLQEQVMRSVGEYLSKFEETKEKISKRHRKLIDYDSSRRLYELMLANVTKKRSRQQQQQEVAHESAQQQPHPQNYQSILRGLKFLSQQQQQQPHQQQQPQLVQESIASQLVDEARLLKLREQFNYCKLMYENINSELHEELPIVYEKKMKSLLQALQNYYAIKAHYHSNAGKLLSVVSEVIEECPQSIDAVLGISRKETNRQSSSSSTNYDDDDGDSDDVEYGREDGTDSDKARSQQHITGGGGSSGVGSSRGDSVVDSASSPSSSSSPDCVAAGDRISPSGKAHGPADLTCGEQQCAPECSQSVGERVATDGSASGAEPNELADGGEQSGEQPVATDETVTELLREQSEAAGGGPMPEQLETVDNNNEQLEGVKEDDEVEITILNTTKPSSAKCDESQEVESDDTATVQGVEERPFLYKVKTNYKYLAEDVDELCFEADEIIQVIEFDENHEPEDGWLLGIREVNNQRGLFPANFTQPI